MKFKLFIQNWYFRCLGIIGSPKGEWIKIKEENNSIFQLLINMAFPLLLIVGFATSLGTFIHREGNSLGPALLIIAGVMPILSISLSLGICILAIKAMLRTFGGFSDFDISTKLVLFTFIPVILVTIVLNLAPEVYLAGLFSLYSFYILHFGTQVLSGVPAERQSNFSTLSSMIILAVYLLVNYILSAIFSAIQ